MSRLDQADANARGQHGTAPPDLDFTPAAVEAKGEQCVLVLAEQRELVVAEQHEMVLNNLNNLINIIVNYQFQPA